MTYSWENAPSDIKEFISNLLSDIQAAVGREPVGFYLHGSLAMGGFHPASSDIDMLVVTEEPLTVSNQKALTKLFLDHSNQPFPLEVSFLHLGQLKTWEFPTLYDYHYSEFWRGVYEKDVEQGAHAYLNNNEKVDSDLAAHFMILQHRGICLAGKPIDRTFPIVPEADYLSAILGDYEDCLIDIYEKPVYSVLNMLRIYRYIKEGEISSKKEAGLWGASFLPKIYHPVIRQALAKYDNEEQHISFVEKELTGFSDYIQEEVRGLLTASEEVV